MHTGKTALEDVHDVDTASRSWLHGFWNPLNARPGIPRLVVGDAKQFHKDKRAARERARQRLDALAGNRYMIIEEWNEQDLTAEEVYR